MRTLTTDTNGYTESEIENRIEAGRTNFAGSHYPNEAERENLPAVRHGMDRIHTAKFRAGWTYDDIEPVGVHWSTRNTGESARFKIEVGETKDFDVNLFLQILYSDEHPLSVIGVETHYSTLKIEARMFDRDTDEAERMKQNRDGGEGEESLKLPSYVPDEAVYDVDWAEGENKANANEIIVQWWVPGGND